MLRFAICDDDPADIQQIADLIRAWSHTPNKPSVTISPFQSPYNLLDAVADGESFEVFLLDILMPEMTGIALGEQLCAVLADPLIVYLTSSQEYYPDAFRLYAFNYICKPISPDNLFPVLDKIVSRCQAEKNKIFLLKTAEGLLQISFHNIVYIELLSHVCHFHLTDGRELKSQYLRTGIDQFLEPILSQPNFIKTHTSFVVNLDFSDRLTNRSLSLTTGATIPVSRSYAAKVRQSYMEHWF